jgi:hypothetical protein
VQIVKIDRGWRFKDSRAKNSYFEIGRQRKGEILKKNIG